MSRPRVIALLLAFTTLLLYLPVIHFDFVNYDDQVYVTENVMVKKGLTWEGMKWAFTTGHASNWHPLTWLSHMVDCSLFGLNPGMHHLTNALFHAANTALVFLLIFRLTGALWAGAFIAALFGWHPAHVESVAWVAERKDVLSTFFALLTLLAYVRYVKENHRGSFWLALGFFALGLMAKPMLVTLPFVMLLLDYWPLQRLPGFKLEVKTILRLALEKWPFFLLIPVSCIVTFLVQKHGAAVVSLEQFPLSLRFSNAFLSYARYVSMCFWPVHLTNLNPLLAHIGWMRPTVWIAVAFVVLVTVLVGWNRRKAPYLLVGWLWFLGTLVPVIGIVQVGSAAVSDRYTYVPFIGLFIALTFLIRDGMRDFKLPQSAAALVSVAILGGCLFGASRQMFFWRDSEALWANTVAYTQNNAYAYINYGRAVEDKGRKARALAYYREAARILPENGTAHYNAGRLFHEAGDKTNAIIELRLAVQCDTNDAAVYYLLGIILAESGRDAEALTQFKETIRCNPYHQWAYVETGKIYLRQGLNAQAIEQFKLAINLAPDNFMIVAYTARVLATIDDPKTRDAQAALALAEHANDLTSGQQPYALNALSAALAENGRYEEAIQTLQKAVELAEAARMTNLGLVQEKLELYRKHQPWRESFAETNLPPAKP